MESDKTIIFDPDWELIVENAKKAINQGETTFEAIVKWLTNDEKNKIKDILKK